MFEKDCVPFAPTLIESMRSIGYSFSSAIADLLDNSISAHAKNISILSEPSEDPFLVILDDGCGMDSSELFEAMRYGSNNPLMDRNPDDLGRFGLGLKSASLSQCRRLVVISKKNGKINGYSWDLDHVISKGSWVLTGYSESEIANFVYIDKLKSQKQGTYILLSNFDRIKESAENISETFSKNLDDMTNHISLVFHRFIEDDGLNISLNGLLLTAKDPFLKSHKGTQKKRESSFYIKGQKIVLQPYILPHISKLSQLDLDKVGGKDRLRNEQGFYVYRNRRLIIWGTWFRLERKDELSKLARVMVDIPNSLDYMWSIDIKKSTAVLPDIIKRNMYTAVYESVLSSETVHTFRGRKENKLKGIDYVWERTKGRDGYEYLINRNIPQLKLLEETLSDKQLQMLNCVIKLLEDSFPTSAFYVDAAKGNIEERVGGNEDTEELWQELQRQMEYVQTNNLDAKMYYSMFMKTEPYCNSESIQNRIKEELKKYE